MGFCKRALFCAFIHTSIYTNYLLTTVIFLFKFADGKVCVVMETLTISPFGSDGGFYQFEGSCDHYLLRLCDTTDELSVTADFTSSSLDSARVGLRYRDSSVVSTETGEVVLNNLSLTDASGGSEIYDNGFVVSRGSAVNHITLQLEGNITVVHMYGGSGRSIQVVVTEGLSFGGTDVPSPIFLCGLCGTIDGTLLQANLLTVAEIDNREEIEAFIQSFAVVAAEQFLRGQRRECSKAHPFLCMSAKKSLTGPANG